MDGVERMFTTNSNTTMTPPVSIRPVTRSLLEDGHNSVCASARGREAPYSRGGISPAGAGSVHVKPSPVPLPSKREYAE